MHDYFYGEEIVSHFASMTEFVNENGGNVPLGTLVEKFVPKLPISDSMLGAIIDWGRSKGMLEMRGLDGRVSINKTQAMMNFEI